MSKIDNITQDLLDKIRLVADFSNRVGLAVGGTEIDPINIDLPRPAAWVVFTGTPILDGSTTTTATVSLNYSYVVKVLIDYGDEATMIASDLPVLENIIKTVKGSEVNNLPYHKWAFDDMVLESLEPDRMVWAITFSIATGL